MKNKALLFIVILLLANSGNVYSQDNRYGVGVTIRDQTELYVPVTLSQYTIETMVSYDSFDRESESANDSAINNLEITRTEISIGLFKNNPVLTNTVIYFGARVGYLRNKSIQSTVTIGLVPAPGPGPVRTFTTKRSEDGYVIIPTIGAIYKFSNGFSIGVDLGFSYINLSGEDHVFQSDTSTSSTSVSKTDRTDYRSEAAVILRYMF